MWMQANKVNCTMKMGYLSSKCESAMEQIIKFVDKKAGAGAGVGAGATKSLEETSGSVEIVNTSPMFQNKDEKKDQGPVIIYDGEAKISEKELEYLYKQTYPSKPFRNPTLQQIIEDKIWVQQNSVSAQQGDRNQRAEAMQKRWMKAHNVNCTMKIGYVSSRCESARKAIFDFIDKKANNSTTPTEIETSSPSSSSDESRTVEISESNSKPQESRAEKNKAHTKLKYKAPNWSDRLSTSREKSKTTKSDKLR